MAHAGGLADDLDVAEGEDPHGNDEHEDGVQRGGVDVLVGEVLGQRLVLEDAVGARGDELPEAGDVVEGGGQEDGQDAAAHAPRGQALGGVQGVAHGDVALDGDEAGEVGGAELPGHGDGPHVALDLAPVPEQRLAVAQHVVHVGDAVAGQVAQHEEVVAQRDGHEDDPHADLAEAAQHDDEGHAVEHEAHHTEGAGQPEADDVDVAVGVKRPVEGVVGKVGVAVVLQGHDPLRVVVVAEEAIVALIVNCRHLGVICKV